MDRFEKKKQKITITQEQLSTIQELLKVECLAVTVEKFFQYVFKKSIVETKHAYCSVEYNTIYYIVSKVINDQLYLLNVIN